MLPIGRMRGMSRPDRDEAVLDDDRRITEALATARAALRECKTPHDVCYWRGVVEGLERALSILRASR
jgi:hypothetical protein